MYYEICISFYRKSFKSAKSRHSEDFELVRQVFIIQKIIPGDMISYNKKLLVDFFSEQTLSVLLKIPGIIHAVSELVWQIVPLLVIVP